MIPNSTREMIHRLSNYRNILCKLKNLGFVKVFSDNLADALAISSSQVRKDFSQFELSGNKKGGYQVDDILSKLNRILGKNDIQKVIIVGAGNIGRALMNYTGFSREGIKVAAAFDTSPTIINPQANIPIFDLSDMPDYIKKNKIQVAVITVPEPVAPQIYEELVSYGISGIVNFAPIQLRGSEQCIVQNINIGLELENVFYFVNSMSGKVKALKVEE